MTSKLTLLLWLAGWGLAVYGVLTFGTLDVDLGHGLCGPWGCAPPLQAVISMHAFWGLLLLPLATLAIAKLPARPLRLLGTSILGASVAAIVAVAGYEVVGWYSSVPVEVRRYLPQRLLFVLVTLTDVPLIQLSLAGLACWVAAVRAVSRAQPPATVAARSASGESTEPRRPGEITLADSTQPAMHGR